jgi:probable phosphoglycerate mutase
MGEGLAIERVLIKAVNVTPYDYVKHGLSRTSLEHLFDVDLRAAPPAKP